MKYIISVIAWLMLAGTASAQHPCDSAWVSLQTVTPGTAYRLQACSAGSPNEARVVINGQARAVEALVLTQPANAAGLALYTGTVDITLPQGNAQIQAIAYQSGFEIWRSSTLSIQSGNPSPTPIPTPMTASPDGTMTPPATAVIDGLLRPWTLVNGKVFRSGTAMTGQFADASAILICKGALYLKKSNGWMGMDSVTVTDPGCGAVAPTPTPVPTPTPTPTPTPVPPPVDQCKADPLTISGIKWPASNTGSRSLTFSTGTKKWTKLNFEWKTDGHHVLTVTDTRGCSVSKTK